MKRKMGWLVACLNLAGLIWYVSTLPATVPTHFNVNGVADGYGPSWVYACVGLLPILLLGAFEAYRRCTRGNAAVQKNRAIEDLVVPAICLMLMGVAWIVAIAAGSGSPSVPWIGSALVLLIAILMVFISNYLGQVQQNRYLGIRTRSTLADETVWRKTHRLGAYCGTAGGLLMAIFSVLGFAFRSQVLLPLIGLLLGVAITVFAPMLYAMNLYNRRHPR